MFKPNKKFIKEYKKLFKKDPLAANTFLMLCELADERGKIHFGVSPEAELQSLLMARFDDCRAYQLIGGPKR